MPREIDDRKKRKALRKLRKAAELAQQGLGPPLTDWEKTFLEDVGERIETYGAAFADLSKGPESEALSALQARKLQEIDRKARGKPRGGFRSKKPRPAARIRQINEDIDPDDTPLPPARTEARPGLRLIETPATPPPAQASKDSKPPRPRLRLVHTSPCDDVSPD